jgi:hypothetical protein
MPDNTILASPIPLRLATGVENALTIGGNYLLQGLPQGWSSANYIIPSTYFAGTNSLRKGNIDYGGEVISTILIPANQPFMNEIGYDDYSTDPANPFDIQFGVRSDTGVMTGIEIYRYPPEEQERHHIIANGTYPFGYPGGYLPCANSDRFRLSSDGSRIQFLHFLGGQWIEQYAFVVPQSVINWRFFYNLYYHNNSIYALVNRIDDAIVPVNTTNSTLTIPNLPRGVLEKRIIDATHYGVLASVVGNWTAHLSNEHIAQELLINIVSTALYIKPHGKNCGTFVVEGETLQFETNGFGGNFEATGGTILPNLKWQAGFSTGIVTFTYTVGNLSANCTLQVVPKLSVDGVIDGIYPDLAQGERAQFVTNCPEAVFRCLNYPSIITRTGHLIAPTDAFNSVFGEKFCKIQVTGCGQTYNFTVHIQALYPIPRYCGPSPDHWTSPLIPDYLPNTVTMTGGTSQVKNRNKFGVLTWEIVYQNLLLIAPEGCSCSNPLVHTDDCLLELETAARLDAFYNLVKYTNYFTVLDYHTEIVYKYVRLTKYSGTHNLFKTEQTRNVTMRQEGDVLFDTGLPPDTQ